jgi:hypothetical protein
MDPTYLRQQAERCRRLADAILDEDARSTLLQLAAEYEERAAAKENEPVANQA